jgi:hypothetical protein
MVTAAIKSAMCVTVISAYDFYVLSFGIRCWLLGVLVLGSDAGFSAFYQIFGFAVGILNFWPSNTSPTRKKRIKIVNEME